MMAEQDGEKRKPEDFDFPSSMMVICSQDARTSFVSLRDSIESWNVRPMCVTHKYNMKKGDASKWKS